MKTDVISADNKIINTPGIKIFLTLDYVAFPKKKINVFLRAVGIDLLMKVRVFLEK